MEVVIYTSISLLSVQGEEKLHPSVYIVYNIYIYIKMGKVSERGPLCDPSLLVSFFLSFLRFDRRETREKVYIARRVVFVVLSKDARLVRGIDLSLASN